MRVKTKHFWDVYIGAAILISLGSILELPPAVAILAYLACAGAFLLAIPYRGVGRKGGIPLGRRDKSSS